MRIYGRKFVPDMFQGVEKYLRLPILFSIIYVYGGLFASQAVSFIPKRLQEAFINNPLFRLLGVLALAYTATGEIEYAFTSSIVILGILHLLRTPEEREKIPYGF